MLRMAETGGGEDRGGDQTMKTKATIDRDGGGKWLLLLLHVLFRADPEAWNSEGHRSGDYATSLSSPFFPSPCFTMQAHWFQFL